MQSCRSHNPESYLANFLEFPERGLRPQPE
jgi:hypothetical protein